MKTVNFIEACNSGKEFYEKKDGVRWRMTSNCLERFPPNGNYSYKDGGEFIAGIYDRKFIIKEKSITITESEFDKICDGIFGWYEIEPAHKHKLKHELGF